MFVGYTLAIAAAVVVKIVRQGVLCVERASPSVEIEPRRELGGRVEAAYMSVESYRRTYASQIVILEAEIGLIDRYGRYVDPYHGLEVGLVVHRHAHAISSERIVAFHHRKASR